MSRTSTYLNFPRNTEEAFNFYKSVFGGEFTRGGLARMGDIPVQEGQSPMAEADKNLVMHVELPILGGHMLMGTDAPQSMGFAVVQGNNMYINLEPGTREEAKRLFGLLSEGGKVGMELQDMFWGAYFGSCTDKFGIQWMFNCESRVQENSNTITVETVIKSEPEKVWEMWTGPQHIQNWNQASVDWECPYAENDVRVGGKFLATMRAKDGSDSFDFSGIYTNVVPFSAIAYTMVDGREVSIVFIPKADGVHIIETFEMENVNSKEKQQSGWQTILDNFKKYVEKD